MKEKTILYIACVEPLKDSETFKKYYNLMPFYRQEKINPMRFQKDKLLSLGVGILLQKACQEFGIANFDKEITIDKFGKQRLKNSDIKFNLSHSGEMVLCVMSFSEVGCDVERKHEIKPKLAQRVFTKNEAKWFNNDLDNFFRLWTLKESYLKFLGTGFSKDSRSFEMVFKPQVKVKYDDKCNFFEGKIDDYYYSCATEENEIEVKEVKF